MRKKLLAVLMTGAMVASFAGSATVVSAKSDDDNKLTVWAWDQNFNIKSMQIAADQYAKDHEGFSVDIIETSSDDCQTKLTTAANAGVKLKSPVVWLSWRMRRSSKLKQPNSPKWAMSVRKWILLFAI